MDNNNKKTMSQRLARQAPPPPVGSVKLKDLKPGEAFLLLNKEGLTEPAGVTFILMSFNQPLVFSFKRHLRNRAPCLPVARLPYPDEVGQMCTVTLDSNVIPVRLKTEPIPVPPQSRHVQEHNQNKEEANG